MIFAKLFSEQFFMVDKNPSITRSNKILIPIHSEIKNFLKTLTKDDIIALPDKEYCFDSEIGSKKVDIAIVNKNNELKAAILFKAIRSEYNKNANNYYENMKGESSLFIDNGIPIYQIIFIPTKVRHKNSKGEKVFEIPTSKSFNNYYNFNKNHSNYWDTLKLGVYYFDIDYENYSGTYSKDKRIPNVENTLTEGLKNFIQEVNNGQSKNFRTSNDTNFNC